MTEQPAGKPILQKPPGYRDPNGPVQPRPRPLPRRPHLPPSFHPKKKRRSCCRICCCTFCVVILSLIFLLLISAAVFYVWYNPKLPVFHLQSFSFPHFNVTVKSDGSYLNAQTLTRVEVRNPNGKLTYYYGDSQIKVTAGKENDVSLGSTNLPGFTQAKKNLTTLRIETKGEELLDDAVGPRLMSGYRSKELVVNVAVRTSVGVAIQGWKIRPLGVNVICGGASLKTLDQAMPRCTINFLRWINLH